MTKDDVMKMASEAGFWIDERSEDLISRFANAVLERAAVECDDKNQVRAEGGFPREAACARSLAIEIRALKIPEGE